MRVNSISRECPTGYVKDRCVTLNHTAGSVLYTSAGAVPTHITLSDAMERINGRYTIEIVNVDTVQGAIDLKNGAGTIAIGAELEVVGAEGKVQTKSGGTAIGLRASQAVTANSKFEAYKG